MRNSSFLALAIFTTLRCLALPLSFEQRDATHFLARFPNGAAELRPDRVSLGNVTLRFVGSAPSARLEGLGPAAPSTYLRAGSVRTFAQFPRLAIRGLYPGVEAIFYGSGANLEYDLQLTRGAFIDRIRISVEGSRNLAIDDSGNLTIGGASGVVQQMRPRVFQGGREISASYVLLGANQVVLRLGKHDRRAPLTIDPVLSYVKTLAATPTNLANLVTTDAQANIYVAGYSNAPNFPTTAGSLKPSTAPALWVLSNAGQSINGLTVANAFSVSAVGATPDGSILYAATSAVVATSQRVLLSVDSGATWQQTAALPVPSAPYLNPSLSINAFAIDSLDPATILVATSAGLYGTDSGGESWGERNTGLNVSASGFVSVVSVFYNPVNPLMVYAVTSGPSHLFASSDAGNTWQPLEPAYPGEPPAPAFTFSPNLAATITPDGSTLYAIDGNGILLKSPDGGGSWVQLASGFFAPVSIQVDPGNSSTLYVLDANALHKSTDGGATFANVTTPVFVRSFAVDSSGAVYVGNGQTPLLYVSTDGTKTFAAVPNLILLSNPTLSASGSKVYVGTFTPSTPFVVKLDPSGQNILYSTYFGGSSGDVINGIVADAQGNAVVVGTTYSTDFPLTVPASSPPTPSKSDGFLAKLSADGTHLLYSTALGASRDVTIQAVTLDSSGAVYVTGESNSADFPATPNAFQPAVPSTPCTRPPSSIFSPSIQLGNAFVSKISANGTTPVYATFLSASCGSSTYSIATDPAGDAVVAGVTPSPDFPVSANSYQAAFPGPVNQTAPAPGAILNAGFLAKLSPAGDKLLAGTFLGGGYSTQANSVVMDASGNAYLTGFTQGFTPGATPGAYQTSLVDTCTRPLPIGPSSPYTGTGDAFALELDPSFSTARFLTYLGGSCNDSGSQIALDPSGNIWISGTTASSDFPLRAPFQASEIQASPIGGFLSELSGDGSQLLFSSFSEGSALSLGPGAVYLAGWAGSSASVSKIDPATSPAVTINSVSPVIAFPPQTNDGFYEGVAPGQLIQISGANLGPADKAIAQVDASGRLPFVLANTVVFFGNIPAPLISVQASSIMCFVPFEIIAPSQIAVSSNGQMSNAALTGIVPSSPQVLNVVNQDGTVNSANHPAKAGSVITLYISGLGQTNPQSDDGLTNGNPLPVPLAAVTVYFPATPSAVTPQFVGAAPGLIAGITQVNVQVPVSVPTATNEPIEISVNGASAPLYASQQ
jgi:uncharacterized protein (TIGR03437 family)